MLQARAIWVATMDGDGQDDPRSVVDMAKAVDLSTVGEVGLVAGNRTNRTDGANRKFASRFANGLRRSLLNDDCPDTACGLKLIVRDVFLAMPFFDALHRYLPALTRHLGYDIVNVPVVNRARTAGASKYTNLGRAAAGPVRSAGRDLADAAHPYAKPGPVAPSAGGLAPWTACSSGSANPRRRAA
jgi:dolichol-phosphate mannosyltransferase